MLLSWCLLLAILNIWIIRFLFSFLEHVKWNKVSIIHYMKKRAVKIMLTLYLYYICEKVGTSTSWVNNILNVLYYGNFTKLDTSSHHDF